MALDCSDADVETSPLRTILLPLERALTRIKTNVGAQRINVCSVRLVLEGSVSTLVPGWRPVNGNFEAFAMRRANKCNKFVHVDGILGTVEGPQKIARGVDVHPPAGVHEVKLEFFMPQEVRKPLGKLLDLVFVLVGENATDRIIFIGLRIEDNIILAEANKNSPLPDVRQPLREGTEVP